MPLRFRPPWKKDPPNQPDSAVDQRTCPHPRINFQVAKDASLHRFCAVCGKDVTDELPKLKH